LSTDLKKNKKIFEIFIQSKLTTYQYSLQDACIG